MPLENRIVAALAAIDITSTDLSQLLVEAEAAIAAADNAAEDERAKALDPALSPDPKAARQAMEDVLFMRDRLKTLLPRLQTRYREIADAEALAAWRAEADALQARRLTLGTEFKKVFSELIGDLVDRLWEMRDLDQEITALNHRRPDAANAAGVRPVDWITPAFAEYLKIPDPEAGSKHWEIGTSGPGYLWPPRQLDVGQQLARMMMANPNAFEERFLAHEAAAGVYLEEGVRRALEDNQRQIAEAEQRQREREEREQAEAPRRPQKPIAPLSTPSTVGRREHRCATPRGCPPWIVLGVKAVGTRGGRVA